MFLRFLGVATLKTSDLNKFDSNAIVVIYDYSGKCVYKASLSDKKITIPTNNFNSGIYQIGLISNNEAFWKKIIIQH
ncbi:MAG: T9SS type A sorting domain-containing protein [Bacteroidales bacterium]|nr:T9SS type A sorting domain-containing protein [Bacteroidales bacterium]